MIISASFHTTEFLAVVFVLGWRLLESRKQLKAWHL
jgi:hypothetical protein